MNTKLEDLIEKIKKDGINQATKQADEITAEAKEKAVGIIEKAKQKAKIIVETANVEAKKVKNNTESSLQQAARDLILVLKTKIVELFDSTLKSEIAEQLNSDFLSKLILNIAKGWSKDQDLNVLVSKADREKLVSILAENIKKQAGCGIEINVSKKIDKGFRIGLKDQDTYYDFTDESIAESLKTFLNPAIVSILEKQA